MPESPGIAAAPTWRRYRLLAAALFCVVLLGLLHLQSRPVWSADQVAASEGQVVRRALWAPALPGDEVPALSAGLPVDLPHGVPREQGLVASRYLLLIDLPAGPPDRQLGMCVERWAMSADVWIDGQRVATAREGTSASHDWLLPHYLPLPVGLGPGPHAVDLVVRNAVSLLSTQLSAVWVGDDSVVRPVCQGSITARRELPALLNGGLAAAGVLALVLGLRLRDVNALWFAAFALVWCTHQLLFVSTLAPWFAGLAPGGYTRLYVMLRLLFVVPWLMFCLHAARLQAPRLERALLWGGLGGMCMVLLLPSTWLPAWLLLLVPLLVAAQCYIVWQLGRHAWRAGTASADVLLLSVLAMTSTQLLDSVRLAGMQQVTPLMLSFITTPLLSVVMGLMLVERMALLYQRQTSATAWMRNELARQQQALERSFEGLQRQRDAELQAQARLRITRELHDGLGSHLVAAAALLGRPQPQPGDRAALATLIDQSLQELRSALDAIGSGQADLAELLGALRDRLEPVLDARGIVLDWQVAALPGTANLGVAERLDVLRIVQEAFANIVKHAGACRASLQARPTPDGGSLIIVSDDGPGLPKGQREGVGLPSMRERAHRLRAGLDVASTQPGCRVTLALPASAA
ncbi:MAG: 7TM diverse intracellular signaling domain-containing protein [Aquabacterium sp.]|nr:7TM diverse intracellular signaling domain-containing protein [Aquabacterium sp.]